MGGPEERERGVGVLELPPEDPAGFEVASRRPRLVARTQDEKAVVRRPVRPERLFEEPAVEQGLPQVEPGAGARLAAAVDPAQRVGDVVVLQGAKDRMSV